MMLEMDGFILVEELWYLDLRVFIIFFMVKFLKVDKLKGFNFGVDDYIVKLVDEEELVVWIKVVFC